MKKREFFNNIWKKNLDNVEVDNLPYTLDGVARESYYVEGDTLTLSQDDGVDVVEYIHLPLSSLTKEEREFLNNNSEYDRDCYSIEEI